MVRFKLCLPLESNMWWLAAWVEENAFLFCEGIPVSGIPVCVCSCVYYRSCRKTTLQTRSWTTLHDFQGNCGDNSRSIIVAVSHVTPFITIGSGPTLVARGLGQIQGKNPSAPRRSWSYHSSDSSQWCSTGMGKGSGWNGEMLNFVGVK